MVGRLGNLESQETGGNGIILVCFLAHPQHAADSRMIDMTVQTKSTQFSADCKVADDGTVHLVGAFAVQADIAPSADELARSLILPVTSDNCSSRRSP